MEKILIIYLAFISALAVAITISDKIKSIRGKWRIKESTLLFISAAGGSAAMLVTMLIIRHKTRKIKFMLGIPIIIIIQIAVFCLLRSFGYV